MSPREIFLAKLCGRSDRGDGADRSERPERDCPPTEPLSGMLPARRAVGSATSIVTTDLMDEVGAWFPEAHTDAEPMTRLAAAGHTLLEFDNVMPLFSVWHESAALGCRVDWGTRTRMPDCRDRLCGDIGQLPEIPRNLLKHPGCAVPLAAIGRLRRELGDAAAVVGKVFGPWTLGYHLYGVDRFLMATLDDPDALRRAMRRLMEVTVRFGVAQVEAGADALTLADHATRDLCSPANYRDFLVELHQELHERLPCPLILHICGDTSDRIPYIATTGMECFHFDSKVSTPAARKLAGDRLALMGGTSNFSVVREGTPEQIAADVAEKAAHDIDIVGPECAVPLDAPWRNLQRLAREGKQQ